MEEKREKEERKKREMEGENEEQEKKEQRNNKLHLQEKKTPSLLFSPYANTFAAANQS